MMTVYATAQDILDRYAHVGLMLSGLTERLLRKQGAR